MHNLERLGEQIAVGNAVRKREDGVERRGLTVLLQPRRTRRRQRHVVGRGSAARCGSTGIQRLHRGQASSRERAGGLALPAGPSKSGFRSVAERACTVHLAVARARAVRSCSHCARIETPVLRVAAAKCTAGGKASCIWPLERVAAPAVKFNQQGSSRILRLSEAPYVLARREK